MKASIVDLRYKMNEVLRALERQENVTILYHGKVKGKIIAAGSEKNMKVEDHPFFGMHSAKQNSVAKEMEQLRGGRYNAL